MWGRPEQLPARGEAGYSMVEMLVAMGLSLLLLTAVYAMFTSLLNIWNVDRDMIEQQSQTRNALTKVSREVRSAFEVVSAKANYLQFRSITSAYSDITPDMSTTFKTMTVTFSLSPQGSAFNLQRTIELPGSGPVTNVIASLLRNRNSEAGGADGRDLFHYYNSQGVELARPVPSAGMVRTVRVGIIADVNPSRPPDEVHDSTTVAIRAVNLGN